MLHAFGLVLHFESSRLFAHVSFNFLVFPVLYLTVRQASSQNVVVKCYCQADKILHNTCDFNTYFALAFLSRPSIVAAALVGCLVYFDFQTDILTHVCMNKLHSTVSRSGALFLPRALPARSQIARTRVTVCSVPNSSIG